GRGTNLQPQTGRTLVGLMSRDSYPLGNENANIPSLQKPNPQTPMVEATGWVINANGQVELVTHAPQLTPQTPWYTPADCHTLNSQNSTHTTLPRSPSLSRASVQEESLER